MDYRARRRNVVAKLDTRLWLRTADIAVALGVSVRTIHRDIAALRKQGVPVEGRRGQGMRLRKDYILHPVVLTSDEATLMIVGSAVVAARLGKDMQLVAEAARKRLMDAATDHLSAEVEALEAALRLAPIGMGDTTHEQEALEILRRGLVSQTAVSFTLADAPEPDTYYPYGLTRVQGRWHSLGYSVSRGVVCGFKVDEMLNLVVQDEPYELPRAYTPEDTLPPDEEPAVPVRVQFDAVSSEWIVAAKPTFASAIHKKGDGIVVTLEDAPDDQVFSWIMGWGAHARVLTPVALQRRIAAEALEMTEVYAHTRGSEGSQLLLF